MNGTCTSYARLCDAIISLKFLLSAFKSLDLNESSVQGVSFKESKPLTMKCILDLNWDSISCEHEGLSKSMASIEPLKVFPKVVHENPWDLNRIVNIATFYLKSGHLRSWLKVLFPTLDDNHSVLGVENGKYSISLKKDVRKDTKKTPCLCDVESFLLMLMLDRQIAILNSQETKSESESQFCFLVCQSKVWNPTSNCVGFWRFVVANYGLDVLIFDYLDIPKRPIYEIFFGQECCTCIE